MNEELEVIKSKIKSLKKEINVFPQLQPLSVVDSQQDRITPQTKPYKAEKEDYLHKIPQQIPISPDSMANKSMDTTGSKYAEGEKNRQVYFEVESGHNRLGETQETIEKAKVYVSDGEQPPKGKVTQKGPRGGEFYNTSDTHQVTTAEHKDIKVMSYITNQFKQAGFKLYEVGGSVRDSILGRPSSD
jgi:hypothetical protein